jgi:hypothetical protein
LEILPRLDPLIEPTQQWIKFPNQYVLTGRQNTARADIDLNADEVFHTWIAKISPQALQCNVIGQYNDVILDVS